jgi:hypothetical protein
MHTGDHAGSAHPLPSTAVGVAPPGTAHGGHEPDNVKLQGIIVFATAFIIVSAVILVSMWTLLLFFEKHLTPTMPPQQAGDRPIPPEPRLQPEENYHESLDREDLAALRTQEHDTLTHYAWVDQSKGIVRIPLSKAMDMAVASGLPVTLPPIGIDASNSPYAPTIPQQAIPQNPK